jgi:PPOX class probable F420-dependent enzyme
VALDPRALPAEVLGFLAERHLGTLTTLRPDGTPHVVAVAFAFDPADGRVRVLASRGSKKVRNLAGGGRAVVCQVDGPRWLALEGPAVVAADAERVAVAEAAYAGRFGPPRPNPERVAIELTVDRVLGRG